MNSCIGAMMLSDFSSWVSWSDNLMMRGLIIKLLDKSIEMLSITVLEPLKILIVKFTVLFRL